MRDQGDTAPMLVVYGAGLTGELVLLPRDRAEVPGHVVRRATAQRPGASFASVYRGDV